MIDRHAVRHSAARPLAAAVLALLTIAAPFGIAITWANGELREALRNLTYPSDWTRGGRASLVDGIYEEPAAPGSASKIVVRLTDSIAVGKIGDQPVAALVIVTDPGGSGVFFDLYLGQQREDRWLVLGRDLEMTIGVYFGSARELRKKAISLSSERFKAMITKLLESSHDLEGVAEKLSSSAVYTRKLGETVADASTEASTNVRTVAAAAEVLASSVQIISSHVQRSRAIATSAVERANQTDTRIASLSQAAGRIWRCRAVDWLRGQADEPIGAQRHD